jgi:uncharacterized protein (TIGR03382 family)
MRRTLLALLLTASPAAAIVIPAPHPAPDDDLQRPSIDARFGLLQRQTRQYGRAAPVFGPGGAPADANLTGAAAILRFHRTLSLPELNELRHLGVVFFDRDGDGEVEHLGTQYAAWLPFDALPALGEFTLLARAECTWRPRTLRPLDTVNAEQGSTRARATTQLDGTGVRIADIDSPVDVLHPHLFYADGGWFSWVDVNGNNRLDAGEDGLDLNNDGLLTANEVLYRLAGARMNPYEGGRPEGVNGRYDAGRDWLYLDRDGSGAREAGRAEGYTEVDWGYGEPIFVGEDLNGDGQLEPAEGLLRLGRSKVAQAIYGANTYTRDGAPGRGMIDSVEDPAAADANHGTGVASISLGGQAPWHRGVGIAPGAELLVYANTGNNEGLAQPLEFRALIDALDQGAAMILHEWTDPFGQAQDGGGEFEAAMGSARAQGLAQVNPLGNLNAARKHIEQQVRAGQAFEATIEVGEGFQWGPQRLNYTVIYGTLMWRGGGRNVSVHITPPGGVPVEIPFDNGAVVAPEAYAAAVIDTNRAGTHWMQFYVYREDVENGAPLPVGDWTITVDGFNAASTVHGRTSDYYSSWGEGIGWSDPTEDRGTLVYPSTADAAFGVAAYGGVHRQDFDGSRPGELRSYSGRGPRMDGAHVVDIAAPDDPYAAFAWTPELGAQGYGRTWFSTFGGTSGAGPHVAGAMALLTQQNPNWGPDELEDHLLNTAQSRGLQPSYGDTPNEHWGAGQLDTWNALLGTPRPEGTAPQAELQISLDGDQVRFDASASHDANGDALRYRLDLTGNARWQADWRRDPVYTIAADALPEGPLTARLWVLDDTGLRGTALVPYAVDALEPLEPDAGLEPDASLPSDAGVDATIEPTPDGDVDPGALDRGVTVVDGGSGGGGSAPNMFGCDTTDGTPATPLALLLGLLALRRRRQP